MADPSGRLKERESKTEDNKLSKYSIFDTDKGQPWPEILYSHVLKCAM